MQRCAKMAFSKNCLHFIQREIESECNLGLYPFEYEKRIRDCITLRTPSEFVEKLTLSINEFI